MPKYYLTDTCYWLGLIDSTDEHYDKSTDLSKLIEKEQAILLVPWPCLYETLSTRLINKRDRLLHFETLITRKPQVELIDDNDYKVKALTALFNKAKELGITTSLTDAVIIEIMSSKDYRIEGLISYNYRDFRTPCQLLNIALFPDE